MHSILESKIDPKPVLVYCWPTWVNASLKVDISIILKYAQMLNFYIAGFNDPNTNQFTPLQMLFSNGWAPSTLLFHKLEDNGQICYGCYQGLHTNGTVISLSTRITDNLMRNFAAMGHRVFPIILDNGTQVLMIPEQDAVGKLFFYQMGIPLHPVIPAAFLLQNLCLQVEYARLQNGYALLHRQIQQVQVVGQYFSDLSDAVAQDYNALRNDNDELRQEVARLRTQTSGSHSVMVSPQSAGALQYLGFNRSPMFPPSATTAAAQAPLQPAQANQMPFPDRNNQSGGSYKLK